MKCLSDTSAHDQQCMGIELQTLLLLLLLPLLETVTLKFSRQFNQEVAFTVFIMNWSVTRRNLLGENSDCLLE